MENKRYYIVCYDISSTRYRNKVVKTLEKYGYRIQWSVFKCKLTKKKMRKMVSDLEDVNRMLEDEEMTGKIYIYPLCSFCYGERIILGETDCFETQEKKVLIF